LDEFRISEGASDNGVDPGKHGKEETWRISSPIPTGHETENCFPAGEAKRWSPQSAMQRGNVQNGFDGTESSNISEEDVGGKKKSDSDLSSAQQRHGDDNYDSSVSVKVSNGFGNGSGDFGVETNAFGLMSRELRDNTIDFRGIVDGEGAEE
jgi:hypothetical protein